MWSVKRLKFQDNTIRAYIPILGPQTTIEFFIVNLVRKYQVSKSLLIIKKYFRGKILIFFFFGLWDKCFKISKKLKPMYHRSP